MRNISFILVLVSLLMFSCDRVKKKTKETINKSGEVVGKTATEFFEGVSEGVDKTLQCEIILSPELKEKELKTGKFANIAERSGRAQDKEDGGGLETLRKDGYM